jgi:hypothetical protein
MAQVHARVLGLACETVGDVERLALALGVDAKSLRRWMDGKEDPPALVFIDALDIVAMRKHAPPR